MHSYNDFVFANMEINTEVQKVEESTAAYYTSQQSVHLSIGAHAGPDLVCEYALSCMFSHWQLLDKDVDFGIK